METIFKIGPFSLRWYSILIVTAILVASWIARKEAKRKGDDPEHVAGLLLFVVPLGLIGARLYHVVSAWDYYVRHPLNIFAFWLGGLGIFGLIGGGALGIFLYCYMKKLNFIRWVDIAIPGVILGQAIGRWGNFFNQELYGPPTSLPWAIYIDPAHRLAGYEIYERFHPLFLYESLWNLAGFIALMIIGRRFASVLRDGDLFLCYGLIYGFGRFFLEFLRFDSWTVAGIATAQWISGIAVVACSLVLFYRHRLKPKPQPIVEGSLSSFRAVDETSPPPDEALPGGKEEHQDEQGHSHQDNCCP